MRGESSSIYFAGANSIYFAGAWLRVNLNQRLQI
jgi:hypothetical protein